MTPEERAKSIFAELGGKLIDVFTSRLRHAIEEAIAEEREACARVADLGAANMDLYNGPGLSKESILEHQFAAEQVRQLAKAIRARGHK
jgi:hypothetical protein